MPEPTAPATPEAFQAEVSAIKDAPFATGESQLDRTAKLEAAYKKQYPEAGTAVPKQDDGTKKPGDGTKKDDAKQQESSQQAKPVEIDWKDPKDSEMTPEVTAFRQGLQTYFGEMGLSSEQASSVVETARHYRNLGNKGSDDELRNWHEESEQILRAEWGKAFGANAKAVNRLKQEFEKRFDHGDIAAAIDNGLWSDVEVNRALLAIARRQDPVKRDLKAANKKLMTANEGSAEAKQAFRDQEAGYKKLYGTGPA